MTTSREDIFSQVQKTMVELFDLEPEKVTLDANLVDELGLDSIDAIDLAARFEEMTGHRLREDGLLNLRTVRDVVDYLEMSMSDVGSGKVLANGSPAASERVGT
jgi:acyl carrier protein